MNWKELQQMAKEFDREARKERQGAGEHRADAVGLLTPALLRKHIKSGTDLVLAYGRKGATVSYTVDDLKRFVEARERADKAFRPETRGVPLAQLENASREADRQRSQEVKSALLYTIRCSEVLLIASSFLMFFCSGALTGLFIKDPDTVAYGSAFLRGFCLAPPVLALDFMCVGTFQAVGMGRESFVFAILRKIVFEIPLLLLLNAIFPLYGLPFAQAIAELMMALIAIPVMIRFFRRCRAQEELPLQA